MFSLVMGIALSLQAPERIGDRPFLPRHEMSREDENRHRDHITSTLIEHMFATYILLRTRCL